MPIFYSIHNEGNCKLSVNNFAKLHICTVFLAIGGDAFLTFCNFSKFMVVKQSISSLIHMGRTSNYYSTKF